MYCAVWRTIILTEPFIRPHKQSCDREQISIGPLQDPVTWYGINYTGTQITQWDFQNKGTITSPARLSFVLKVPLRHLRPSVIYSVPCDWVLQRAYCLYFIAMLGAIRVLNNAASETVFYVRRRSGPVSSR